MKQQWKLKEMKLWKIWPRFLQLTRHLVIHYNLLPILCFSTYFLAYKDRFNGVNVCIRLRWPTVPKQTWAALRRVAHFTAGRYRSKRHWKSRSMVTIKLIHTMGPTGHIHRCPCAIDVVIVVFVPTYTDAMPWGLNASLVPFESPYIQSCQLDPCPTWLLKGCSGMVAPIMADIINRCISAALVPTKWSTLSSLRCSRSLHSIPNF